MFYLVTTSYATESLDYSFFRQCFTLDTKCGILTRTADRPLICIDPTCLRAQADGDANFSSHSLLAQPIFRDDSRLESSI